MTAYQRFLFDTAFTRDGAVIENQPPPPSFSQAELEAARAAAFEAGKAEGRKEAAQFAARLHTEAIREATQKLQHLLDTANVQIDSVRADATALAHATALALAQRALETFGAANAHALVDLAMEDLRTASVIRLRAPPSITDAIGSSIEERLQFEGANAKFSLMPDPSLGAGELHLDFPGGGLSFSPSEIAARINDLFSRNHREETPGS